MTDLSSFRLKMEDALAKMQQGKELPSKLYGPDAHRDANDMAMLEKLRRLYISEMTHLRLNLVKDSRSRIDISHAMWEDLDRGVQSLKASANPNDFSRYMYDNLRTFNVRVPETEAQQMKSMMGKYLAKLGAYDNPELRSKDNRGPETSGLQANPEVGPQVAGWPKPAKDSSLGGSPGM